jgi:hypothetical protein
MLIDSADSCRTPGSTWLTSSMAKATAKRKIGLSSGRVRRNWKAWISDGDHLCENGVICKMKASHRVQRSSRSGNELLSLERIRCVPRRRLRRLVYKSKMRGMAGLRCE